MHYSSQYKLENLSNQTFDTPENFNNIFGIYFPLPNANFTWEAKPGGGDNFDTESGISTDDTGNSYVTGQFQHPIDYRSTRKWINWKIYISMLDGYH